MVSGQVFDHLPHYISTMAETAVAIDFLAALLCQRALCGQFRLKSLPQSLCVGGLNL
jgi:hypothetical protein